MSLMSKAEKLARYHALVDLGLQGSLQSREEAELAELRLRKQLTKEQTRFDASRAKIRTQVGALRVELAADASNRPKSKSATVW